jgi:hypothetical protein
MLLCYFLNSKTLNIVRAFTLTPSTYCVNRYGRFHLSSSQGSLADVRKYRDGTTFSGKLFTPSLTKSGQLPARCWTTACTLLDNCLHVVGQCLHVVGQLPVRCWTTACTLLDNCLYVVSELYRLSVCS